MFQVINAEVADQTTIAAMIPALVSRSSPVVALYWHRPRAICESHAQRVQPDSIATGDGLRAKDPMKGHLADLLSIPDLRERPNGAGLLCQASDLDRHG